jgi:hypothetical protein
VCLAGHRFVKRFWTSPTSQSQRTEPRTDAPKMPPFSGVGDYDHSTTIQPLICQFCKNIYLISPLIAVVYKKAKIWHRIQYPPRSFAPIQHPIHKKTINEDPQDLIGPGIALYRPQGRCTSVCWQWQCCPRLGRRSVCTPPVSCRR